LGGDIFRMAGGGTGARAWRAYEASQDAVERGGLKGAVHEGGKWSELVHEALEVWEVEGLGAVAEGVGGVGVDFDHEAVGTDGDGGTGEGRDGPVVAGGVGGVHDDREVGEAFDGDDGGEVLSVSEGGFEGADAAFAEDDAIVALAEDIFGGLEEFVDGGGQTFLEENGFSGLADGLEEGGVLHVAGADLETIGVAGDEG